MMLRFWLDFDRKAAVSHSGALIRSGIAPINMQRIIYWAIGNHFGDNAMCCYIVCSSVQDLNLIYVGL
jgi:hypothetical protein